MSKLELFEGAYVELRDGRIDGPLKFQSKLGYKYPWYVRYGRFEHECWTDDGQAFAGSEENDYDIVRVTTPLEFKIAKNREYGKLGTKSLAPSVLAVAMEAGMKARPAYEEFVAAIVTAALGEVAKQSECKPRFRVAPDLIAIALDEADRVYDPRAKFRSNLRSLRINKIYDLIESEITKNESSLGSNAEQKTEGGLSGSDESGQSPGFDMIRTIDKLHPATRAFLEAVYPDAPLRAVEFTKGLIRADFGERLKPHVTITVGVSSPGTIPMWVDDRLDLVTCSLEMLEQLFHSEQITVGQYIEAMERRRNESVPASDDQPVLGV